MTASTKNNYSSMKTEQTAKEKNLIRADKRGREPVLPVVSGRVFGSTLLTRLVPVELLEASGENNKPLVSKTLSPEVNCIVPFTISAVPVALGKVTGDSRPLPCVSAGSFE
jgi:hypothetical protein